MNFSRFILVIIISFISSVSLADVYVELDDGIEVLAHNGKEISSAREYDRNSLRVNNGINQLLVEYNAEVKSSSNESEILNTGTYVISFEATDEHLLLTMPRLSSSKDFAGFKKAPKWLLSDNSGKKKNIKVDELIKEGFQLNRSYERELAYFNMTRSPAAVLLSNELSINNINVFSEMEMAGKMLRYWYINSTPEVRSSFKKWINE